MIPQALQGSWQGAGTAAGDEQIASKLKISLHQSNIFPALSNR